jgi:parallel beta-helix repeat protein
MSQSHRSSRTARPCATFVARAAASTGSAAVLAATFLLVTACGESTAPVSAARPIAGATSGLIRVAAKGLATAAGTARDPMTLEQAVAVAPAGATIELSAGTYVTGGLVITRPVTIRAASGAKVILRGSTDIAPGMWQAMGSTWRTPWSATGVPAAAVAPGGGEKAAGATTTMATPRTTPEVAEQVKAEHDLLVEAMGGAAEYAAHQHMAFVDGRALQRVTNLGDVKPGTFYVDAESKFLYIGENPGGHEVALSAQAVGMLLTTGNTRITGLTLEHFSQVGLRIQGAYTQVDHNTLEYNGLDGLMINAASNALVQDNAVKWNGQAGIVGNAANAVTVEDNNISNNNTGNYDASEYAAGIKVTQMTNFVFRGNWVADNKSNAVWIDVSSTNSTVVGNQVLRSASYGIYIEQGNGIIIAANIVHDNTDGIGVHFTENASVYNNTVTNNGLDLDISAWDVQANTIENAKIVNNLIWNGSTSLLVNLYRAAGCNSTAYSEVDYNGYYRPSGSAAKNAVNWCNDFFTTIGAFHSKTGYEAHGLEIDGGGDPFFVAIWSENYHLHSGSPAINRGQPLPTNIAAALGWRAGIPVSMGAVQD